MAYEEHLPTRRAALLLLCVEAVIAGILWLIGLVSPALLIVLGALGLAAFFLWDRGLVKAALAVCGAMVFAVVAAAVYEHKIKTKEPEIFELQHSSSEAWVEDLQDGFFRKFKVSIGAANYNKFKLYLKYESRYASIDGKGTDLIVDKEEGKEIETLESNLVQDCTSDAISVKIAPDSNHKGEINCVLHYGASPDKLDRTWQFKRKFEVYVGPNGRIWRFYTY